MYLLNPYTPQSWNFSLKSQAKSKVKLEKAFARRYCVKKMSQKCIKIYRKGPVPEIFCNRFPGQRSTNLLKKERQTLALVNSCEFCTLFKNAYFIKHLQRLVPRPRARNHENCAWFGKLIVTTNKMAVGRVMRCALME